VDRLRVLAVRAEPPEAAPGEVVALDLLLADPHAPAGGRPVTFLWIACATPPGTSSAACSQLATQPGALPDPGTGTATLPPCDDPEGSLAAGGLCLLGTEPQASYAVPAGFLDGADPARDLTVIVTAAAGATDAVGCLLQVVEEGVLPLDCQVSYKSLRVSRAAAPNHNPTLSAVFLDDALLPEAAATSVGPGEHDLTVVAAEGAAEALSADDGGATTEALIVSWFLAAPDPEGTGRSPGTLDLSRTEIPGDLQTYTAPEAAGPVQLFVVVRDDRGGVGWLLRDLTVTGGTTAGVAGASRGLP
jgi:hypothetical protein